MKRKNFGWPDLNRCVCVWQKQHSDFQACSRKVYVTFSFLANNNFILKDIFKIMPGFGVINLTKFESCQVYELQER